MAQRQLDRFHKRPSIIGAFHSGKWRLLILGVVAIVIILGLWLFTGQGDSGKAAPAALPELSRQKPPHGGIGIPLGKGKFGLEMVLDPAIGDLRLYVMGGHFRRFVPIRESQIELLISEPGEARLLRLRGVANRATRETQGDTAMFQCRAAWLKGIDHFRGTIRKLRIRERSYTNIAFEYVRPDRREDGEAASVRK